MAEATMGYIDNPKDVSKTLVQGTLRCSCGAAYGGLNTVAKGTKRTWTCTKCKRKVTVVVPK